MYVYIYIYIYCILYYTIYIYIYIYEAMSRSHVDDICAHCMTLIRRCFSDAVPDEPRCALPAWALDLSIISSNTYVCISLSLYIYIYIHIFVLRVSCLSSRSFNYFLSTPRQGGRGYAAHPRRETRFSLLFIILCLIILLIILLFMFCCFMEILFI